MTSRKLSRILFGTVALGALVAVTAVGTTVALVGVSSEAHAGRPEHAGPPEGAGPPTGVATPSPPAGVIGTPAEVVFSPPSETPAPETPTPETPTPETPTPETPTPETPTPETPTSETPTSGSAGPTSPSGGSSGDSGGFSSLSQSNEGNGFGGGFGGGFGAAAAGGQIGLGNLPGDDETASIGPICGAVESNGFVSFGRWADAGSAPTLAFVVDCD